MSTAGIEPVANLADSTQVRQCGSREWSGRQMRGKRGRADEDAACDGSPYTFSVTH